MADVKLKDLLQSEVNFRNKKQVIAVSIFGAFCLLLVVVFLFRNPFLRRPKAPVSENLSDKSVLQATTPERIVVDHNSVALFEQIPPEYLEAAKNIRVVFSDRSVGQNINEYLDCLTATSWDKSKAMCRNAYYDSAWNNRTFTLADLTAGRVPQGIVFTPDPVRYSRANWTYVYKQGIWHELTKDFITSLAPSYLGSKDMLTYQFSYLNVQEGETINDPVDGFFSNSTRYSDVYDLENFIAAHSDKTFVFWTTSLARNIGNGIATTFNDRMRQYAQEHNKILFDVADIESYTLSGMPCFDTRDGVQFCNKNGQCENSPDDGVSLPAICQEYTTETLGGHLGSVSTGGIRLAKAFWVLMAQIAGWNPNGSSTRPTPSGMPVNETPSPTVSPTALPTASAVPTFVPTVVPTIAPTPSPVSTPQSGLEIHSGDIDAEARTVTGGWQGRSAVYVHNSSHQVVVGATVTGAYTGLWSGTVTCVTNSSGWCALWTYRVSTPGTVEFIINNIAFPGYSYMPSLNHDVDGSTNGTSATITR